MVEPVADGQRLLIVDDDADTTEIVAELLRDLGYVVDVAADGETAMRLAREQPPQVALLDIEMPRISGYDLLRQLREQFGPRCGVIAVTAHGNPSDIARGRAAGFDCYLVKPISLQELAASIAEVAARVEDARS